MIGTRIKQLRKELGLTQADLGNKLGVIKQTISSWENDISNPNNEALLAMSSIFGVTVDYLLGNESESSKSNTSIKTASVGETSLRRWIEKTGYGYSEIAAKLEILEDLFMDYMNDRKDIPYQKLSILSEICEVSTDCLLGIIGKSRERDFDKILPFKYNYKIAKRIKEKCEEKGIDTNSSYLENLLSLTDKEVFYLIEYGFVPHVDTIIKLAKELRVSTDYLLCQIGEQEEKALKTFKQLNDDNQDIIIGEMKKNLKEQVYNESVAAEETLMKKTGTDSLGK